MKKNTRLKDMTLTSVDFCKVGANQEAFIMLKKSEEEGSRDMSKEWEQFSEKAVKSITESVISIMEDETLDKNQKEEKFGKSIGEFMDKIKEVSDAAVQKAVKEANSDLGVIDMDKMDQKDKEVYEGILKKYFGSSSEKKPDLHPEVKKALEEAENMKSELEEMKKSLEIGKLEIAAKKYEILGKKPEELAPKLYDMKKSGGTAYDDYISLLDEQLEMTKNSGIFKEFGSNRNGGNTMEKQLAQKIEEMRKADNTLTYEQAFIKVCDTYPEIKKAVE